MDSVKVTAGDVLEEMAYPPSCVAGMKELDKTKFRKIVRVPALRIEPKNCSILLKNLSRILLNQPRMKNIFPDPDQPGKTGAKLLLLHPAKWPSADMSEKEKELMSSCVLSETEYELTLEYEYWTCEQILRAILPQEIDEVTTAFETVGHIAHMNLRDSQLQYKNIIGEVILDKNHPQIRTVVNKANTIDETFRFFKMEVLAGESDMNTTVKEHGCVYKFDFSKVYWNSRLQTEHSRLVAQFNKDDVICDVFAGVGPFAIPASKKGCTVYANDLNPDSFKSLQENRKLNRVNKNLQCFNMDGREFIKHIVKNLFEPSASQTKTSQPQDLKMFSQVVMNLPAMAVQFLDVFQGLFVPWENTDLLLTLPTVHCYCFSKASDPVEDARRQAELVLGCRLDDACTVYYVRDVAPNKAMLCVSFKLPREIAFQKTKEDAVVDSASAEEVSEPAPKQPRVG